MVITVDGEELPAALVGIARPVDPGKHTASARGEDVAADEKSVELAEGAHESITLALHEAPHLEIKRKAPTNGEAPASTGGLRIGGFVTLGIGVAALGVGAAFVGLGFAKRGQANDAYLECGEETCVRGSDAANEVDALDKDASTKQTVGLAMLIAGGVLSTAGVVMVVVSGRGTATEPASKASLVLGPGTLGLAGTF